MLEILILGSCPEQVAEKKGETTSANYSFDGYKKKGAGDYNVIQYDGRTPTKVVVTCVIIHFMKTSQSHNDIYIEPDTDPDTTDNMCQCVTMAIGHVSYSYAGQNCSGISGS